MTQHALYRFRDVTGKLLYVGITLDPAGRFQRHERRAPWWTDVATITIEPYPDRASVLAAEVAAIHAEIPAHNIQHQLRHAIAAPKCCKQSWRCPVTRPGKCRFGEHHHCQGQVGHYEDVALGCGYFVEPDDGGCPVNGHCVPSHHCLCGVSVEAA